MPKTPPFALVIGLDRSDTQAEVHLIDTHILPSRPISYSVTVI